MLSQKVKLALFVIKKFIVIFFLGCSLAVYGADQTDTRSHTNDAVSALVVTAPNRTAAATNIPPNAVRTNVAQTNIITGFDLTLDNLRGLVAERNENLQMRMLEYEISQRTLRAERGIFEPSWWVQ